MVEQKLESKEFIELERLFLKEKELRKEFRELRTKLESLVQPITDHNQECVQWWNDNLPGAEEILVEMKDGPVIKMKRPKREACKVESYLPYGIDFEECVVIKSN